MGNSSESRLKIRDVGKMKRAWLGKYVDKYQWVMTV